MICQNEEGKEKKSKFDPDYLRMRVVKSGDAIEIGAERSYNMCAGRSEKRSTMIHLHTAKMAMTMKSTTS